MRTIALLTALAFASSPQEPPAPRADDWERFVPLGLGDSDPGLSARLGGKDGAAAVAAYDLILQGGGLHAGLDFKALRDGAPLLKRRVLAALQPRDYGARRAGLILDALISWDHESCPLRDEDLETAALPILMSIRPEHEERLKSLAAKAPEHVQKLAQYGLAALGDEFHGRGVLLDFMSKNDWRLGATARVLARQADPVAGPRIRDLLASRDKRFVRAGITALAAFPKLDASSELSGLLDVDDAEIQTLALRQIAVRKINLALEVWAHYTRGQFTVVGRECSGDAEPPFMPLNEVGPALLVADDPDLIDRLVIVPRRQVAIGHSHLLDALFEGPPPKTRARLLSMLETRGVPGGRGNPALGYLQYRLERSESMDEVLELLEKSGNLQNSPNPTAVFYADPQTPAQKERLLAMCRGWIAEEKHPLRFGAGMVLHRWGVKEGTEDLLKVARGGGPDAIKCLGVLGVTADTRPLILEHLKGPDPFMSIHLLARAKDEVVIPHVMEAFKAGRMTYVGGDGGLAGPLKQFKMRDLTDEMVALLEGSPHQAHIVSVLSYLRWRERKDKAALVRPYLSHRYGLVLEEAAEALADWKDPEAFDAMEKLLPKADTDQFPRLLHAMMRLDPERAWPHFMRLLPVFVQLQGLQRFAGLFPRPGDASLVRRLLLTESSAGSQLPRVAARMFGAAVADELLVLAEEGNVEAATGLAYVGDRRGIEAIASRLDQDSPVKLLNALDLLVNGAKLAPVGRVKIFESGPRSGEEAAKQIREAFGVEVGFAGLLPPREVTFEREQDLLESLERLGAGRYPRAHITRDGRVDLVPLPEARAYWIAWREKARK